MLTSGGAATSRSILLTLAVVTGLGTSATACVPHYDATGLHVANQTGQTFWIDDQLDNPDNRKLRVPAGQTVLLPSDGCQQGLEAQTEDGTVVASLDQEWCPGQTWRVRSGGEAELLEPTD